MEKSLSGSLRDSWAFGYDAAGNRFSATRSGAPGSTSQAMTATHNAMNQLTTLGGGGRTIVSGTLDEPGQVAVGIAADGQAGTVTTAGTLHNGRVTVDNAPDGAWANIAVTATGFSDTGHRWVPPASVIPSYDDDGNLLADGRWTYTWDAMNRLVAMAPTPNALAAGVPNVMIAFAYDFASRRIGKKVTTTSGTGTTVNDTRYLYDGRSRGARRDPRQTADRRPGGRERNGVPLPSTCVAEFEYDELDGLIPKATYVWSLDLSGTLQGAGGVGGLLSVSLLSSVSASSVFLPCYDANGNIIAWADGNGSPAQRQDYDPFGNLVIVERLAITPTDSARLTYGFSTKPLDAETGLHYYGFRFYDGRNGRWINQDPIGVNGGINLYGFVGNDGIGRFDILGLIDLVFYTEIKDQKVLDVNGSERRSPDIVIKPLAERFSKEMGVIPVAVDSTADVLRILEDHKASHTPIESVTVVAHGAYIDSSYFPSWFGLPSGIGFPLGPDLGLADAEDYKQYPDKLLWWSSPEYWKRIRASLSKSTVIYHLGCSGAAGEMGRRMQTIAKSTGLSMMAYTQDITPSITVIPGIDKPKLHVTGFDFLPALIIERGDPLDAKTESTIRRLQEKIDAIKNSNQ